MTLPPTVMAKFADESRKRLIDLSPKAKDTHSTTVRQAIIHEGGGYWLSKKVAGK